MGDALAAIRRSQSHAFWVAVAVAVFISFLEVVWILRQLWGPTATQAFTDLIDIPVALAAAVACWLVAKRERARTRLGWVLLGSALASWAIGEAIWSYYELVLSIDVPFPSLADAGFLGLIPLAGAALICLPAAPNARTARGRMLLDGLIIATSLFAISWATALSAVFNAGGSVAEIVIGLAYPFGDVVLLGVLLFVGARAQTKERTRLALIGAGIVFLTISDSFFTYTTYTNEYFTGNLIDTGWTVGFLLIGLGALARARPHVTRDDSATSTVGSVLPYIGILFAVPIAAYQFLTSSIDPVVFWSMIAMFGVVAARQLLTVLENRTLAFNLETKVSERTAELKRALDQVRDAAHRQEEFVAHASHELFTPLTTIVGALDMLSQPDVTRWDEAATLLDMAGQGAKRMTQLVDDLMLATGLTGFIACEREPFDVTERLREGLDRFDPFEKTVETHLISKLQAVGDHQRFRSALDHVLSNADKFGPRGSTIKIEARAVDHDIVVTISDQGPGIPREQRDLVFERFYRTDVSDTRRHEGLGLGLFLTRQVLRAMGGDVTILDTSSGCAVRIVLPAHQPMSTSSEACASRNEASTSSGVAPVAKMNPR